MKVLQLHQQTQKQLLNPTPTPKIKIAPKLSQDQMSEQKETQKMKVVQLDEQTPKQFLNPTTHKISQQGPKKLKMTPKLSKNLKLEFKELQKIKVVQIHKQTPKQLLNPTTTPKIAHQGSKKSKRFQSNLGSGTTTPLTNYVHRPMQTSIYQAMNEADTFDWCMSGL